MAIPAGAVAWAQPMDPADVVDYVAQAGGLMTGGEIIADVTVTVLAEAVALGLTVIEDAEHGPFIADDTNIWLWFKIDPAMQANAAFVAGASLPVEITIDTDATPPRTFQRTMIVKVIQL